MATRPIKIAIVGDDSNLRKSLKGASRKLEGFGKSVAKFGVGAGVAFAGVALLAGVALELLGVPVVLSRLGLRGVSVAPASSPDASSAAAALGERLPDSEVEKPQRP